MTYHAMRKSAPDWVDNLDLVVFRVGALLLAGAAQVIVGTDHTLVARSIDTALAPIAHNSWVVDLLLPACLP